MKIHEYQAKALLRQLGVPVPKSKVVLSAAEARNAALELQRETGNPVIVVKSQIHAGGRGKGRFKEHPDVGGVKVVKDADEAGAYAAKMFDSTLVTIQTGPEGKKVKRILIEQGLNIAQELYLGMTLDRVTGRTTVMASTEGGMEIEEVAAHTPEKILRETIDPAVGLQPFQARKLAFGLGLQEPLVGRTVRFLLSLAAAYTTSPTSRSTARSAAWSTAPAWPWRRWTSSSSTAPSPANFLDVGGGATKEKVTAAFKIITADPA
jgi:succinyl-CoA synthetase beta subunit